MTRGYISKKITKKKDTIYLEIELYNQNKNILKYCVFSNKTKSIPIWDSSRKNDASAKMKKSIRSPIQMGISPTQQYMEGQQTNQ